MNDNFNKLNDDELDVVTGGGTIFLYQKAIVNHEEGYNVLAMDLDKGMITQGVIFVKDFAKYKSIHKAEGRFYEGTAGGIVTLPLLQEQKDALGIKE